jgi:mRNA-degrading endonuclease RelE of RelBE toxin-antitoxin system
MLRIRVRKEVAEDLAVLPPSARELVLRAIASLDAERERREILLDRGRESPVRPICLLHAGRHRVLYTVLSSEEGPDQVLVLAVVERRDLEHALELASQRAAGEDRSDTPTDWAQREDIDVFVSYAVKDAQDFARELADALQQRHLRVWLDEYELSVGDSIAEKVDDGLARSRYAALILSPAFFQETWSRHELEVLLDRESRGDQVILPIWHGLTRDEIMHHAPLLADRVAVESAGAPVEAIADSLAAVVSRARHRGGFRTAADVSPLLDDARESAMPSMDPTTSADEPASGGDQSTLETLQLLRASGDDIDRMIRMAEDHLAAVAAEHDARAHVMSLAIEVNRLAAEAPVSAPRKAAVEQSIAEAERAVADPSSTRDLRQIMTTLTELRDALASVPGLSTNPRLREALPEVHLRAIRERYRMDRFFEPRKHSIYFDAADVLAERLRVILGYEAPPLTLRSALSVALAQDEGLLRFLQKMGANEELTDSERWKVMVEAAAGTIIARWLDDRDARSRQDASGGASNP